MVALAIGVLLIGTGLSWRAVARAGDMRLLRELLGADRIDVIRAATRVESHRLKAWRPPGQTGDTQWSGNLWTAEIIPDRVLARGPDLDAGQVAELTGLLLDPETYLWDVAKACAPTAGVGLRFVSEKGAVDVALCFECDMLAATTPGAGANDRWEDFDPIRPQLVRLVKALFPNDPVIQGLRE